MLTDIAIRKAEIKEKPYKLTDGQGMYLLIKPNGSKYWRLKYRFGGKEKVYAIGVYPKVKAAQAREKRDEIKNMIQQGIDPSIKKTEAKLLSNSDGVKTIKEAALEWYGVKEGGWSDKHKSTILSRLEYNIFPHIGNVTLQQATPQLLIACLRKIEERGAYETAHRCQSYLSQIFRYSIAAGLITANPAAEIRAVLIKPTKQHYPALPIDELPEFWSKLDADEPQIYTQTRLALKILIYTFVRTNELIYAPWTEIDLENRRWVVPAERMKMTRDFVIPLSDQVHALFTELKMMNGNREWVLPSVVRPRKTISNNTILHAVWSLGYKHSATPHGFRAMASTTINERNMARSVVVEKQLAHEEKNKVKKAYDRAEYMPERVKLMQDWADYVDRLVGQ